MAQDLLIRGARIIDGRYLAPGLAADLVLFAGDLADLSSFDHPTELASGIDRPPARPRVGR